uniref:Uncharacterized protein n=1 Tax=Steinernema glaseri TaxID=37863 RepID=A0A1I7ZXM3_9BILA
MVFLPVTKPLTVIFKSLLIRLFPFKLRAIWASSVGFPLKLFVKNRLGTKSSASRTRSAVSDVDGDDIGDCIIASYSRRQSPDRCLDAPTWSQISVVHKEVGGKRYGCGRDKTSRKDRRGPLTLIDLHLIISVQMTLERGYSEDLEIAAL